VIAAPRVRRVPRRLRSWSFDVGRISVGRISGGRMSLDCRLGQPLAEIRETVANSCAGSCAPGRTTAAMETKTAAVSPGARPRLLRKGGREMHRYRLTFDPNAKDSPAATRPAPTWRFSGVAGGTASLSSSRRTRPVSSSNSNIHERENPLELYQHPYAYLTTRGHAGELAASQRLGAARRTASASHPRPRRRRPEGGESDGETGAQAV
jgi:hypothetical protein